MYKKKRKILLKYLKINKTKNYYFDYYFNNR